MTAAILTITNGVTACLMIAAVSLQTVGAIGPGQALALAAGILYGRWRGRAATHPLLWDAMAVLALLLFPFDLFLFSRDLIGAALRLLTFVVIYRCSNLTGPRELRQALSLSFVQMLAAAASTTEVWFSLALAVYLFMAIWTMMAMAAARDDAPAAVRRPPAGRPVLAVTLATVGLGTLIFIAIPHLGTGYFQRSAAGGDGLTGFADRIELGSISRIKRNHAIVMRARVRSSSGRPLDAAALPIRWRGVALDTFDGRSWSVARPDRAWIALDADGVAPIGPEPAGGTDLMEQEISLSPLLAPVLFASPGAVRLLSGELESIGLDDGGSIYLPVPSLSRLAYTVVSPEPSRALAGYGGAPGEPRQRYLTLPRHDPRIGELSRRVTREAGSDLDRARRLESWLRASFGYTLDVNDAGVSDPIEHFLLRGNPGHCEYFATAMAVMLRHLGIPSRVVSGFSTGTWSQLTESFVVRQSDAHSWVEAHFPGHGWVTFDPTPAGGGETAAAGALPAMRRMLARLEILWDTWVIGIDLLDQQAILAVLMDRCAGAAAAAARAARDAGVALARFVLAGWTGAATLFGAIALLLALLRPIARHVAWLRRLLPPLLRGPERAGAHPAAELLRAFEARWASRGVRRATGQTPLELAREIERRGLEAPGAATGFVESYYRSRFGSA